MLFNYELHENNSQSVLLFFELLSYSTETQKHCFSFLLYINQEKYFNKKCEGYARTVIF